MDTAHGDGATRVMLVDDHPLFRTGLTTVLEAQPDLRVVAHASSLAEVVEQVETQPVDLVILDIMLPNGDGASVVRALRERKVEAQVLGLSVLDEPVRIVELLRAGATGFVHKTQPVNEIVAAVRETLAGSRYLYPRLRERLETMLAGDEKMPFEILTAREREVFGLLVEGHSNESAAKLLGVALRTVETHRQRVMKKLGAHSVAELVRLAARWGRLQS